MINTRWLIALFMGAWLAACDNQPQQPESTFDIAEENQARALTDIELVLKQFIDASISRQHAAYYDLLSARDQTIKTKEKYLEEQQHLQPNLADAYFHEITYQITSITLHGAEARAEVVYTFPDVERMIKQVYNLSVLESDALPALDDMKQQIDAAFQDKPLPMKQATRQFNLAHENETWRVYLAWKME